MWHCHPHSSTQIVLSRPLPYNHPFLLLLQWLPHWPPQPQALLLCLLLQPPQRILWPPWLNRCLWPATLSPTLAPVCLPHLPPSLSLPPRTCCSPAWSCLTKISSGSWAVLPRASRTQSKQWVMQNENAHCVCCALTLIQWSDQNKDFLHFTLFSILFIWLFIGKQFCIMEIGNDAKLWHNHFNNLMSKLWWISSYQ